MQHGISYEIGFAIGSTLKIILALVIPICTIGKILKMRKDSIFN